MVANTDAVILDLRFGLGGSPEMVNYIASAFFRKRTRLADIYIRHQNITYTYWTSPDTAFNSLHETPLYILTSYKTFSAAEGLSYELQKLNRATIVGEVTRGGAHTTIKKTPGFGFVTEIPCGNATIRNTKSNWEKTGVIPDILVSADNALEIAELKILDTAISKAKDSIVLRNLKWQRDITESINHPVRIDSAVMENFSGVYGACTITYSKGSLYYQKAGRAKFPLVAMTGCRMKPRGNDSFMVDFILNHDNQCQKIITWYDDGRMEYADRSEVEVGKE